MTEKRFIVLYGIDETPFEWDIIDNQGTALIEQGNGIAICNKLNELHEENQSLKQQLKTKHIVNKQYEELQRLKEENKKLHRVIEENEKIIQSLRLIKNNLRNIKTQWNWIMESVDYD